MCKSKERVPIGQGCKVHLKWRDIEHTQKVGMCEEHFWLYLNVCLECGEMFHSERFNALTCSPKCRKRRQRHKDDQLFQMVLNFAHGGA
jgi:hypothetical protein